MTLEEFADRHEERRVELALRSIRGESMTDEEEAELTRLNSMLASLLHHPSPLPDEVKQAIEQTHRLLGD